MNQHLRYEPLQNFDCILDLLVRMVESSSGQAIPAGQAWLNDRQTLAKKFVYHLHTARKINDGSLLQVGSIACPIVDHASFAVLVRAAVENFLVFAFVYGDPDQALCHFRHMTWQLAGLLDRQNHRPIVIVEAHRQKLQVEKMQIDGLRGQIQAHPHFQRLTLRERKAILEKRDWKAEQHWHMLAVQAGLNERYFRNIYRYLSIYSHSSYPAALQVGQCKSVEAQSQMAVGLFGSMNIATAHFVFLYANLMDTARAVLEQSEALEIAKAWRFTSDSFDKMYRDLGSGA